MKTNRQRPGLKHRLRLYERFFGMFVWPTGLLAIATYILWWISYDYPVPVIGRGVILLLAVLSWIAFVLSMIAPSFCYVQCHPDYVVVSAVYPLAISYARIGNAVPINFNTKYPLNRQTWSQRTFLEPLFFEQQTGQLTVVGMQLSEYPLPKVWLRLWLNHYMFFPPREGAGFYFIVRDWMLLSQELEDFRDHWRTRRNSRGQKGHSIAGDVLKQGGRKR
jgi:hypothetical protein